MDLRKLFIVLGPPGSGRATQSHLLAKTIKCDLILIGEVVQEFIKGNSPESKAAAELYKKGQPQPDSVITSLLREQLLKVKGNEVILGMFPLSIAQAESLDEIIRLLGIFDFRVIFLNTSKDVAVGRLMARQRSDDTPEIAAQRFDDYEMRNGPIKDYYKRKGVLIEIDAEGDTEKVQKEIIKKLGLESYAIGV